MVKCSTSEKIKAGKLVKVEIDYDTAIREVRISGDFFLYPEECLADIEKSLIGQVENEDRILKTIRDTADRYEIEMIGVTPEAMAHLVSEAIKKAKGLKRSGEAHL